MSAVAHKVIFERCTYADAGSKFGMSEQKAIYEVRDVLVNAGVKVRSLWVDDVHDLSDDDKSKVKRFLSNLVSKTSRACV